MSGGRQGEGAGQDPAALLPSPLVLRREDRRDEIEKAASLPPLVLEAPGPDAPVPRRPRRSLRPVRRVFLGARIVLLVTLFGLAALALEFVGKPVHLPVWVVAEVEARLNRALAQALPEGALSVGGIEVTVGDDWVPHLVLEDLRLLQQGGQTLLTLPETQLNIDPAGLVDGQIRAQSLRIAGARIALRRDRDGHFDLALGNGQGPKITSLAEVFAAFDRAFALPALSHLQRVEVQALTLSLNDLRAGRTWEVGDGHLSIENRPQEMAAELSLSLVAGGTTPATAVLTAVAAKGGGTARLSAQVDQVAARDLAAQTPILGWLGVLDAPISGRIAATIDTTGIAALDGQLEIAAGALHPSPKATPIPFDRASFGLGYDPAAGRILLTDLSVQSRTLRLTTKGQAYMVDDGGQTITGPLSGRRPAAFLGQIEVSDLSVDPEGLFEAPVQFSQGALDLRLRLDPFSLDIGQVSLSKDAEHLGLSGKISADQEGWRAAFDLTLNQISRDRLLAIWPLRLVPGTRSWVESNIRNADLSDVRASVRIAPGTEPKAELSYDFAGAELHFMPKMPPVTGADGYATIQGKTYTLVMSKGRVTPPQGGGIDVSGSVFAVPDITAHPAYANIDLRMAGGLTSVLSLMDQPPFHYLQKAGQPVDLGQGQASVAARFTLPLIARVMPWDVTLKVAAEIRDFASDKLVKGHRITAPVLKVAATTKGMTITGMGLIGKVPFDGTFAQDFAVQELTPQERAAQTVVPDGVYIAPALVPAPPAQITGTVTLSQDAVTEFGLGLPRGMVSGAAPAAAVLDLPKGVPPRLHLTSDLQGLSLAIPELGWRKAAAAAGALAAEVRLGPEPQVTRLSLSGAGLEATGQVLLHPNGTLDVARFDKVTMGGWLNGAVEIKGRGTGVPVSLAVTSGSVDLRKFPSTRAAGGGATAGSPLTLTLDSLRVTDGIRITPFSGDFSLKGGFNGTFFGAVNGVAPITGSAIPTRNGTAVRIQSNNAGLVIKAANLFASARGGALDLTLLPREEPGEYDGSATIQRIRVNYGSVMADLLSAISVIGLIDQLKGDGIVFENAEAEFLLTPTAIDILKGSAIGASMGVSLEGLYHSDTTALDMRGVVSPIYMLNGIGSLLTRRGEGLFGFAYRLKGTAAAPDVSVNPLSILTPGMFRDLFRAPAPKLPATDKGGGG